MILTTSLQDHFEFRFLEASFLLARDMQLPSYRVEDWPQRFALVSLYIAFEQAQIGPRNLVRLYVADHLVQECCRLQDISIKVTQEISKLTGLTIHLPPPVSNHPRWPPRLVVQSTIYGDT